MLAISKSLATNSSNLNTKSGIITLMYHRFDENKYPSTNIKNEIFKKHLEKINNLNIDFINFIK